jgi:DNA ligase-1
MFPEIVEAAKQIPSSSFILDSEVIGWNSGTETFKSYQDTMTRRRKYGVGNARQDVPVKAFLFDILSLDGKDLLEVDTEKRLELLEDLDLAKGSSLAVSESVEVKTPEQAQEQFDKWTKMGLEGLIAKQKMGGYAPGDRNYEWIKMKKSISKDLVDSVDLVVLGYYYGSGKRAGFGVGAILGGVYNPEKEQYESVTSIGTGITDEMFKVILGRLETVAAPSQPKSVVVEDILKPDVWVHPEVVITVEADSISKAIGKKDKPAAGLSLRFPRLIEFDRDKDPQDATSVKELEEMYKISVRE